MPFGYVPDYKDSNFLVDLALRFVGLPVLYRRIQARSIFRFLKYTRGRKLVDIGCGDGVFCLELEKRGWNVIGIDVNVTKLKKAKERVLKMGSNVEIIAADAQKQPFRSDVFDIAVSNCALEHMYDDESVIRDCYRILRKNGSLILTVPTDKPRIVIPIVLVCLRIPRSIRSLFAPEYLQLEFDNAEDALWWLKNKKLKEIRNYSVADLSSLLSRCGFVAIDYEYNLKIFGAAMSDLITGVRFIHLNEGMAISFPLMYPIALFDELLPKNVHGNEFAIIAQKVVC